MALDRLYESAETFAEVYAAIVEALVAAAIGAGPRARSSMRCPGSPLVAERTVELLRGDPRVDLTVVPGLSFLDLAWERLGIDPLGAGRAPGGRRAVRAAGHAATGVRYLVAQCWSQALLSEIKLSAVLRR